MTDLIQFDKKKEDIIEEIISNFLTDYPWFERRLTNMDPEHRDAVGILLETNPRLLVHIKAIFDKNLDAEGFDMLKPGYWRVTRSEQTLMGALGIPSDGDTLLLQDFKSGSGIIGLDGVEIDSVLPPKGQ